MRTYKQIRHKVEKLYGDYKTEVLSKGYSKNMGDKYINAFDDYIGDIYNYDYHTRQGIVVLKNRLFDQISTNPKQEDTKMRTSDIADIIKPTTLTKKNDIYTARYMFFYTRGKTAGDIAKLIKQRLPSAIILYYGEHWVQFRGGALSHKQSYWWVKFKLPVNLINEKNILGGNKMKQKNPVAHYHYDSSNHARKHVHFGGGVFHEHDHLFGYGLNTGTLKDNFKSTPKKRSRYFGKSTGTKLATSTAMNPKKGNTAGLLLIGGLVAAVWYANKEK